MSLRFSLLNRGDLWWFHPKSDPAIFDLIHGTAQIHQKYADLIYRDQKILKRIRSQKRIDPYRKYFRSQALRETQAAKRLRDLEIHTPHILGFGVNLSPFGTYESVLLMEYIPNIGTLREILEREKNQAFRETLIKKLERDLERMIEASIYHKDAHPGNILVAADSDLVWIDSDLSPIRGIGEYGRLFEKFLSTQVLTDAERQKIKSLYSRYKIRFAR